MGRFSLAALLLYGLVWLLAAGNISWRHYQPGLPRAVRSRRRRPRRVTAIAILVVTADWATIYVNSQLDIHRGALAELAAQASGRT
jgi:hypothetical protein